jgi:hypothetical protein
MKGGTSVLSSGVSRRRAGNATEVKMTKVDKNTGDENAAYRVKVRALNDAFRTSFAGGQVVMTSGVAALADETREAVTGKIKAFDAFDKDNDPWDEHDFISVEHDGQTFFAKIDYYDRNREYGSEDPSDPLQTCRVMTIMLAEEY